MNIIRLFLVTCLVLISQLSQAQSLEKFYSDADTFFKSHIKNGLVDFKSLHQSPEQLEGFYKTIGAIDLHGKSDNEKIAFNINAYNLIVIHQVTKYYPLKSVMNRSGFFDKEKHLVAGEQMTLNELEKGRTIAIFKDPRVHFAFSCGALGCPQIGSFAFKPNTLDEVLTTRTKRALNDPVFTKVDTNKGRVKLSKIFEWYLKDFVSDGKIITYLNKYRTEKIPSNYKVSFYEYDWGLNKQ